MTWLNNEGQLRMATLKTPILTQICGPTRVTPSILSWMGQCTLIKTSCFTFTSNHRYW
jgi:hypothetical protein